WTTADRPRRMHVSASTCRETTNCGYATSSSGLRSNETRFRRRELLQRAPEIWQTRRPMSGLRNANAASASTYPEFIHYQIGRLFVTIALEMQSVAVGWQVYELTKE